MGELLRDIGILIGILPMIRPEPVEQPKRISRYDVTYSYLKKMPEFDKEERNFFNLFQLNSQEVIVNDRKRGSFNGVLTYEPFADSYAIKTSCGLVQLKVKNLENITENKFN